MEEQAENPTPAMAKFQETVQQMNHAREALHACKSKLQTMEKAMQAAQADADEARAKWRGLLRDGDGTINKEGQRLRAAERSAYTLQEEYREIIHEMQPILAARNLELAEVANACISCRSTAAEEAARAALSEIVAGHGAAILRAMELNAKALYAGEAQKPANLREWGSLSGKGENEARSHFMFLLEKELLKLEPAAAESDAMAIDLSDVDMQLVHSHAKRAQIKRFIAGELKELVS